MNRVLQEIYVQVSDFVEEKTNIFTERINELIASINKAVEDVMSEFVDVSVGDPIAEVARELFDIKFNFDINIPNDDDESID